MTKREIKEKAVDQIGYWLTLGSQSNSALYKELYEARASALVFFLAELNVINYPTAYKIENEIGKVLEND